MRFQRYTIEKMNLVASCLVSMLSCVLLSKAVVGLDCSVRFWEKESCRLDNERDLILLFSDRRFKSSRINWKNWSAYLQRLACRCAHKARSQNMTWFSLQYYGECWSKHSAMEEMFSRYPVDKEDKCVGKSFNRCREESVQSECVGRENRAYFYRLEVSHAYQPSVYGIPNGPGCSRALDVALVIDTSSSIGEANFNKVIEFLKMFVDHFNFPRSGSRFALLRYDHVVNIDLMLDDSSGHSLAEIKDKISDLKYTGKDRSGATVTQAALKQTRSKIFNDPPRHGVPRTCILMTDGRTWGGKDKVIEPADRLRKHGVQVVAVGIGEDIDPVELSNIAKENVFLLHSYEEVLSQARTLIDSLVLKACSEPNM